MCTISEKSDFTYLIYLGIFFPESVCVEKREHHLGRTVSCVWCRRRNADNWWFVSALLYQISINNKTACIVAKTKLLEGPRQVHKQQNQKDDIA